MTSLAPRLLAAHVALVFGFLYAPILLMGLFSFDKSPLIAFPLQGFTLDWYAEVLRDDRILGGLATTFMVAGPATLITTVMGTCAAFVLVRGKGLWRLLFAIQLALPFLLPRIVFAIGQVTMHAEFDITRGLVTLWVAESLIILPFATIIIASVLIGVDRRLEEAAADLGAGAWATFRLVTLPLIKNGIMAAAFIAFVLATAEYTVAFFTSGRQQPLSVMIASDFRFDLSPKLNALAMLIVLFNVLVILLSELVRRRRAGPTRHT